MMMYQLAMLDTTTSRLPKHFDHQTLLKEIIQIADLITSYQINSQTDTLSIYIDSTTMISTGADELNSTLPNTWAHFQQQKDIEVHIGRLLNAEEKLTFTAYRINILDMPLDTDPKSIPSALAVVKITNYSFLNIITQDRVKSEEEKQEDPATKDDPVTEIKAVSFKVNEEQTLNYITKQVLYI